MHPWQTKGYEDLELSTQIVIKEALRRVVDIEVIDRTEQILCLQKNNQKRYIKDATITELDSYMTYHLMGNKYTTKLLLQEKQLQTAIGLYYQTIGDAENDHKTWKDRSLYIKPNTTNFGSGITRLSNPSLQDYTDALDIAFSLAPTVLIEEEIQGSEHRFLCIDFQCVAVLERVAAHVTGDGTSTIRKLIEEKNRDPRRGTDYSFPFQKIKTGSEEASLLENAGLSFESILQKDQRALLRSTSNITTGGESIDRTDDVDPKLKDIATQAAMALNAKVCGVDIIIPDNSPVGNYCILELNFNPALFIHEYPYTGKGQQVGPAMLDLLGF